MGPPSALITRASPSIFKPPKVKVTLGPQRDRFEGARVFVLPNPSGRNANFSYQDMLAAFAALNARRRARRR